MRAVAFHLAPIGFGLAAVLAAAPAPAIAQNAPPAVIPAAPSALPAPAASAAPSPATAPTAATPSHLSASANLQPVQIALTADVVQRFIASYPDLSALADQLDQRHPPPESSDEEEEGPEYMLSDHLDNAEDAAAIAKVLAQHGFASYGEWANVAHSVAIAADAADAGPGDLDAEKKQALAAVDADKSLGADEKAGQRQEIENQFAALGEFVPPPGNVAVVKPFLPQIRALDTDSDD